MISRELVVVEIFLEWLVAIADVDNGYGRIVEIVAVGIPPAYGSGLFCYENAAGEEFVFVGASWVSDNLFDH
jgi:hypothetical protein